MAANQTFHQTPESLAVLYGRLGGYDICISLILRYGKLSQPPAYIFNWGDLIVDFLWLKEVVYKTIIFIFIVPIALIIGKLLFKKIGAWIKKKKIS